MYTFTSVHDQMENNRNVHLDNETILSKAPSVFCQSPDSEVSDRYGFVPTIQVVDALRSAGWYPVEATQKQAKKENLLTTKHLVKFRRLDNPLMAGDSVIELLLTNSHNRSAAFQLHAGVFRFACANGLVTCDQTFGKISVRHNSNAPMKVVDGSHEIITHAPKLIENVETMQAIQLSRPEQEILANTVLDYILPEDTDESRLVTSRDNLINQSLRTWRTSDQDSSLWSTFNKLQERALKGGLRMQKMTDKGYKRSTTRAVNAIDKNIKLNKALWSMAEQMKELKG